MAKDKHVVDAQTEEQKGEYLQRGRIHGNVKKCAEALRLTTASGTALAIEGQSLDDKVKEAATQLVMALMRRSGEGKEGGGEGKGPNPMPDVGEAPYLPQ